MKQITNTVLMIRPASFRMNEETAVNNYFQKETGDNHDAITMLAQQEFDDFVTLLRGNGVNVIVVDDIKEQDTPDALFPNNWVSFHEDGKVVLYPMFAINRRRERRIDIIEELKKGYNVSEVIDFSDAEKKNVFLEGTGSLILDRPNKKAYCAVSPRADKSLLEDYCKQLDFTPIAFTSNQSVNGERLAIYHTNVMMCVGSSFAVVCLDSIDDLKERQFVEDTLINDGKEIIEITEAQVHQFAGNMLEVANETGDHFLVMSATAKNALTADQIERINKHCSIIAPKLDVIETHGGGSARCMLAEVFLPKV